MFSINTERVKQLESDLEEFAERALPFATRATVNGLAFAGRREWVEEVRNELVTRNKFTERSIRVVPERRELNIRRQEAVLGSTADYMLDLEFGYTKTSSGKEGTPIATGYAAGQEGQQPRDRLPRKPNKLASISLRHRQRKGKSRKQRNFVAIREAAASNRKFVFLDLARRKGIFKVVGGKRKPRLKMVWDMTRRSVRVPAHPTMRPAVGRVRPQAENIYGKALEFQLKRRGLFRS